MINFIVVGLNHEEIEASTQSILRLPSVFVKNIHVVCPEKIAASHQDIISYKDLGKGIFAAMDIPIAAIGDEDFILYINAGDTVYPETWISNQELIISDLTDHNVVVYSTKICGLSSYLNKPNAIFSPPSISDSSHQALIYKRSLHKSLAAYHSLSADRYFMIELLRENLWCYRFLTVSGFTIGGISNTPNYHSLFRRLSLNRYRRPRDSLRWILKTLVGARVSRLWLVIKFFSFRIVLNPLDKDKNIFFLFESMNAPRTGERIVVSHEN